MENSTFKVDSGSTCFISCENKLKNNPKPRDGYVKLPNMIWCSCDMKSFVESKLERQDPYGLYISLV